MLATKFASNGKAQTTHALRARISHEPERRPEEVREANGCMLGSDFIDVLLLLLRDHSSSKNEEDVCFSLPKYIMVPSHDRYERQHHFCTGVVLLEAYGFCLYFRPNRLFEAAQKPSLLHLELSVARPKLGFHP